MTSVIRNLRYVLILQRHKQYLQVAPAMTSWRRPPRPDDTKAVSGKRRHTRYLLNAPITAVLSEKDRESRSRSRTLDVSESGIGGLFHENWEPGIRLKLEVAFPIARTPLKLGAIVRYRTGLRYGFEFVDLLPEERATLHELCQFLAARPAP
jgi:PilZ domain